MDTQIVARPVKRRVVLQQAESSGMTELSKWHRPLFRFVIVSEGQGPWWFRCVCVGPWREEPTLAWYAALMREARHKGL